MTSVAQPVKRAPAWRRCFEYWLMRKFLLRAGPVMIQRRGYWWFVDQHGQVWRLDPMYDPDLPLRITKEQE